MSDDEQDEKKLVIKPYHGQIQLKNILNEKIPEFLPKLPIIGSIIARTNSGKTVLIVSLVNHYIKLGVFRPQDVFYFSPSIFIDDSYGGLPDGIKKFEQYDESMLLELMAEMKDKKKTYPNIFVPQILLVFDDMLAENNENGRRAFDNNSVVSKLFVRGRHLGISTLVSTQKYTSLSRTIRVNSLYCIFLNSIEGEVESIMTDHASTHRKKEFLKMWESVFDGSDPYVNLTIDTTSKNPRKKYIVNFDYYVSYM